MSRFSVEFFLSHSPEKLRKGTLWCSGIENFMHKKVYYDFLSKIFCLTVPKIFVGEPYSVSLISGIEKC